MSDGEQTTRIDRMYDVDIDRLKVALQSLLEPPKRTVRQHDETTYKVDFEVSEDPVPLNSNLIETQQGARLQLTLRGSPPSPNAVRDRILDDLTFLLPEPDEVFDG